jgi:hypothetical protein
MASLSEDINVVYNAAEKKRPKKRPATIKAAFYINTSEPPQTPINGLSDFVHISANF